MQVDLLHEVLAATPFVSTAPGEVELPVLLGLGGGV